MYGKGKPCAPGPGSRAGRALVSNLQRWGEIQERERMGVSIRYIIAAACFGVAVLGYVLL